MGSICQWNYSPELAIIWLGGRGIENRGLARIADRRGGLVVAKRGQGELQSHDGTTEDSDGARFAAPCNAEVYDAPLRALRPACYGGPGGGACAYPCGRAWSWADDAGCHGGPRGAGAARPLHRGAAPHAGPL